MPDLHDATLVIPAYNEERRIAMVLDHYLNECPEISYIVIAEGDDSTADIAREIASGTCNVKVIVHEGRLGKGGAVFLGFRNTETSIVGFVDCDTSVSATDVKRMLSIIDGYDAVMASRRLESSDIIEAQPLLRRFASRSFNLIIRMLFSIPWKDTQCGAKFFKKSSIDQIIPKMNTTGFEFDVELLWRMYRRNMKVLEYPVEWKHSDDSTFRLSDSFGMIKNLLIVRLKNI